MTQERFAGSVVLVTGAAGALGQVVTREFLTEGARVLACDVSEDRLSAFAIDLGEYGRRFAHAAADLIADDGARQAVQACLDVHGRIDVVANIAGGYLGGVGVPDLTARQWDFMQDLNVRTVFNTCRAALPSMRSQKHGKIVNVSARAGLSGIAGLSAYSVAKAGVRVLTESLSEEVKDDDINVNAIMPSIIDTPANRESMPTADHATWVSPTEIARVILFLASEDARAIHGAAIPVYGRV